MGCHYETTIKTIDYNLIIPSEKKIKIWVVEGESPIISEQDHQILKALPENTTVTLENLTKKSSKELRLKEVYNIIGEYYVPASAV